MPDNTSRYAALTRPAPNGMRAALQTDAATVDDSAPVKIIDAVIPLASWFSTSALETAIAAQSGDITSTSLSLLNQSTEQTSGYSLGLAPWSRCPAAVSFKYGGQQSSTTVVLKPGQVITPQGANGSPGAFSGFTFGAPTGWLGGGDVHFFVFRTPTAYTDWTTTASEMIVHRQRALLLTPAAPLPTISQAVVGRGYNWPQAFPWPFARASAVGSANQLQPGTAKLDVTFTKVALVVDAVTTGTALQVAVLARQVDALDINALGFDVTPSANPYLIEVLSFESTVIAGQPVYSYVERADGGLLTLGGSKARFDFVVLNDNTRIGQLIDIVRYGVLGG